MTDTEHPRAIRSFVIRTGRITAAQERALETLWSKYGVDLAQPSPASDSTVAVLSDTRSTPWNLDTLFGRQAPRTVEIGFGNGDNLVKMASAHPERDYLGIEVHRPGIGRLLLALQDLQLTNVRVACYDAVEVLTQHIAADALDEVVILFPDPWPKKRHHKRRLVQSGFLELVAERLRTGGVVRMATDWQPYAEEMLAVAQANPRLENLAPDGTYIPRPAERVATRFEKRGERLGHDVWDLAFVRM
jgi:tRNA (guanine-N7-)-methyltransferase